MERKFNEAIVNSFDPFEGNVTIRLKAFDMREGYKPSTYEMIKGDMDVMDPADILVAVADGPEGGLKLKEVVRLINDIANEKELAALTVAEPMPRLAIRLKEMLANLPLMTS